MTLFVAAAAVAVVVLALRELPRLWVERLLAQRLAADVELGSFAIHGPQSFELGRLRVLEPGPWPEVRAIHVDSLAVETGIRAALAGRFRELTFDGLEVVLAPGPVEAALPQEPGPEIEAALVDVRRARLVLGTDAQRLVCDLVAVIEELGPELQGRARIRCPRLESAALGSLLESRATGERSAHDPLAAVRSGAVGLELDGVSADLLLGRRAGGVEARLGATSGRASVQGEVRELGPLAGRLSDEAGGPRLTVASTAPGLADELRFEAWLDGETWQWRSAAGTARNLRLGAVHELLPPRWSAWTVEGSADLDLAATPEAGVSATTAVTLLRLAHSGVEQPVRRADLRLEARLGPAGAEPQATVHAGIRVPEGADRGAARSLPHGLLPMAAEIAAEWSETEDRLVVSGLSVETDRLGRLDAAGSVRAPFTGRELLFDWTWSGAPVAGLVGAAGATAGDLLSGSVLEGFVSGRGRLQGALPSLRAAGTLQVDGLELARASASGTQAGAAVAPEWSLRARPFEIAWGWTGTGAPISLSVDGLAATLGLAGRPDLALQLGGRGRLEPGLDAIGVDVANLDAAALGRGALSGRASSAAATDLRLQWTGAALPPWLAYLVPEWEGPWDDLSLHGALDADLRLQRAATGPWRAQGSLVLAGGGFAAAGGARVMDGLRLAAELEATLDEEGAVEARSRLRAGGLQVLWGTVFGDYSSTEVELAVEGRGHPSGDGGGWAWSGTARSPLAGEARLTAGISLEPPRAPSLSVELEIGEVGGFLAEYVQSPLALAGPLAGLRADGALTASLTASLAEDARSVAGRIVADGLGAQTDGGALGVRGFDLDLPVDLVWRQDRASGASTVEGPPLRGELQFAELSVAGLAIEETSTTFLVEGDSAALEARLTVPLLGGRVHLDRLTLVELLRPGRGMAAALRLDGIQLAEVSRALDLFPLEGEVSGEFPHVRLIGDSLQVDGGGRVSVFGGEVEIHGISGSRVFSDFPRLELSARFRDIDLERLTHRLDFGEITGRIEGRISDLELFRGTPVRFRALLANAPRRDGPQTLSLKAIDNIALLGGGGGVGVLDQGIRRFLDTYRYRELGLAMVLDNDHFLLRGLARRGADELFIKGRPPIRLDMVNVKPGRTVSFRTMMERLRNLEVSRRAPGRP